MSLLPLRGSIPETLLQHECVIDLLLHVCLVYQQLVGTARLPACALVRRWVFAVGFAPGFGLACFAAQISLLGKVLQRQCACHFVRLITQQQPCWAWDAHGYIIV